MILYLRFVKESFEREMTVKCGIGCLESTFFNVIDHEQVSQASKRRVEKRRSLFYHGTLKFRAKRFGLVSLKLS